VVAVEAGGDELIACRVGQHVARELFDGELVERHVALKASITQSRQRHMSRSPSVW
jgi:hypothetical protein